MKLLRFKKLHAILSEILFERARAGTLGAVSSYLVLGPGRRWWWWRSCKCVLMFFLKSLSADFGYIFSLVSRSDSLVETAQCQREGRFPNHFQPMLCCFFRQLQSLGISEALSPVAMNNVQQWDAWQSLESMTELIRCLWVINRTYRRIFGWTLCVSPAGKAGQVYEFLKPELSNVGRSYLRTSPFWRRAWHIWAVCMWFGVQETNLSCVLNHGSSTRHLAPEPPFSGPQKNGCFSNAMHWMTITLVTKYSPWA